MVAAAMSPRFTARALPDYVAMTAATFAGLSAEERAYAANLTARWMRRDVQANQLLYYRPVSAPAETVHTCCKREIGVTGGRRSGNDRWRLDRFLLGGNGCCRSYGQPR